MPRKSTKVQTSSLQARDRPILLDTHIAVWLSIGQDFEPEGRSLIEQAFARGELCISPISAWEIGMLVSKNRLDLGVEPIAWFDNLVKAFHLNIVDMTPEIAIRSSFLTGPMHGDPADRILIATAMANSLALASADKAVTSYASRNSVPLVSC